MSGLFRGCREPLDADRVWREPLFSRVGLRLWTALAVAATLTCGDGRTEPENGAPSAVGKIPDQAVAVDDSVVVDALPYFADPDDDSLAYSATLSDASRAAADVSGGTVTVTGMAVGSTAVTVTATDPGGLAAEQIFEVTVPNRAPRAVDSIADREVEVDSVAVVDVAAYFADPDRDSLAYSATSSDDTRATAGVSGSVLSLTGVASGAATVTVRAADPGGLTAEQVFGVAIPNRPPVATGPIDDREVHVDDTVAVDLSDYFADPDGDALEYAATSADTARASVSVSGSTVTISGASVGSTTVAVVVGDTAGLEARQSFGVTIPNRAPVPVGAIADRELHVGDTVEVNAAAFFADPDRQELAYAGAASNEAAVAVAVSGSTVTVAGAAVGNSTVTVTAEDPGGLRAEQVFGVTVPNRAPVAVGEISDRMVEVDSVGELDVGSYFSDPDGQELEYSAASSNPDRATVAVSGSLLAIAGAAAGRTTVTVRATDPGGLRAEQSFGVLVPNRAPVAVGAIGDREVHVNDTVALDVAGYFADPDGDTLAYAAASSNAAHASVSISGSAMTVRGRIVGSATVTVTARDPEGLAAEQRLLVTVPNRAPKAVGTMGDREVHVGDTAVVHAGRYFTDPDGQELRYAAESSGSAVASVTVSASRVTLVARSVGNATVAVTARDPGGLEAEQRFGVTVPNRPPEPVGAIANRQVEAGGVLTLSVSAYFREPDRQALRYSAVSSNPDRATAAVSGSTLTLAGVAKGGATVTVTATDPGDLAAEQRFRVTVPNRAPVTVGVIEDRETHVGDTVEVDFAGNFADPDGDSLEYAIASSDTTRVAVSASGGSAAVWGAGVGRATVTVTARDPEGLAAVQRFAVVVANRAPEPVGAIADREVHVGETVEVDAAGYFTDPDGEELTYAAVSSSTETATVGVSGSAVSVSGAAVGSLAVTVTARDPGGLAATQEFRVTVPNRPPEPVGVIEDQVVQTDSVAVLDVAGHFADPDGQALGYSAASSDTATATATVADSSLTLEGGAVGTATVTLTARDPGGLTAEQVFEVLVPNRAPVAVGTIADREVRAGSSESVDVAAYFRDPDGDVLQHGATSSDSSRATVEVSGSVVTLWGVAGGSATVTVTATDPGGLAARQTVAVTVPNRAPEPLGAMDDLTIKPGTSVSLGVSPYFTDPDGDELTYAAASSGTAVATVEVSGDTVAVTGEAEGDATVTVTARDPDGLTATQLFDVTVADNQPPEPVGAIPDRTVAAGDEVSINVEPYFTDPDGDDLEYSAASSSEAVATVDLAGEGRLDVQGRARGEATVTVTATDPGGLAAAQEFEVEVPNRAPYVDRGIEDLDAIAGRAYRALLTDVFVDPDGDPLDYAASSSDTGVAEPEVRGDTIFIAAAGVGTATVGVAATDAGGLSATEEFEVTVTASLFDLRLGRTSDVTDTLLSLIRQVGEEWEAILRDTELTDVEVPDTVTCLGIRALDVGEVDDHLVLLDVDEEDGVGGILAYAGYCYVRSSDGSPLISAVVFDEADVDTLLHYGSMEDVIFHEIAHGLGFISRYWDYKDLLDDGDDPHFEGDLAVEAFDDAGGDDYDGEKVPISSPDHSHWRKSVFGTEGMTPSLRLGVKNPFSAITLQAMADVDYEVDVSLADDYELPDNSAPPPGPPGDTARVLDLSNDVASTPVTVLGRDGRIIRVIRPPPGPGVVRNRLREARLEPGRFPDGPEEDATYRGPGRTTMWRLVRESASGRPR